MRPTDKPPAHPPENHGGNAAIHVHFQRNAVAAMLSNQKKTSSPNHHTRMKILIINGPNLNLLGRRQPEIYGTRGWEGFYDNLKREAEADGHSLDYFQSNCEGAIVDRIQQAGYDGETDAIVINPGAYSHYSIAIADALASVPVPAIEVHISNIMAREEERRRSVTASACRGMICGLGLDGYRVAVEYTLRHEWT